MTRRLNDTNLKLYTVRFTDITSYKIGITARSGQQAISLAKLRWYRGGDRGFSAFCGETHAWDAELE